MLDWRGTVADEQVAASSGDTRMAHREQTLRRLRRVMVGIYFADVAVLAAVLVLSWQLRTDLELWANDVAQVSHLAAAFGPWIVLIWVATIGIHGGYSPRHLGAGAEEFRSVAISSIITAGSLGLFCYLFQVPLPRGFVVLVFTLGTPLLLLERYAVRKAIHALRVRGRMCRKVVAVGGIEGVREVVGVLKREKYVGYDVVGVCLPAHEVVDGSTLGVPVLGTPSEIKDVCDRAGSDTVLIARGGYASSGDLRRVAWALENTAIDMVVVPSLTDIAGPRISVRPVAGLPLLHVEPPQSGRAGGLPKRMFDLLGALVLLVVSLPVMILVAAAVKLEDGGPAFFKQRRVGRGGTTFTVLKFRSMCRDAQAAEATLRKEDGHRSALWKRRADPRVTRVGAQIRRLSLDELPQLLNVVTGHMSLVGPRPQQPWEVASYDSGARRRLAVRPGMTGLWQVSGRSELSWEESVRLDLYYVDNWSMMADLVIIAKTVRAVLGRSGAY